MTLSVCDMRNAYNHHKRHFDAVLAGDNSVPHLMSDDDIRPAFGQFYEGTRPGGFCVITVRDYEKEVAESRKVRP